MEERSIIPIINLKIVSDYDVLWARRRTKQIAHLLGMDTASQVRIATAVSEIARNAVLYAKGAYVHFNINERMRPIVLEIVVADKGPGIGNLDRILKGEAGCTGMSGAKHLVDEFRVDTSTAGTNIVLGKCIGQRSNPFTVDEVKKVINALSAPNTGDPIDEMHAQNQELLSALETVTRQQAELQMATKEMEQRAEKRAQQLTSELRSAKEVAEAALSVKSRFLSTVSHEVRTPLSAVIGFAEVLSKQDLGTDNNEIARTVLNSSKRLLQILNDILDASRLEAGKMQLEYRLFPVRSLVGDVTQIVAREAAAKGIKAICTSDERLPEFVCGDELRVRQILLNLTFNAIKFTNAGVVQVSAELTQLAKDETSVRFSVRDTGIGIAREDQLRLFNPFEQVLASTARVHGGTGLGLSICRYLVDLMGGQMGVTSEVGVGSTFWFEVPFRMDRCQS